MKREIIATVVITLFVLHGLLSTITEVEENKVAQNPNKVGYSELIDQNLIFDEEFDNIKEDWDIQGDEVKYNRLSTNYANNIQVNSDGEAVLTTTQNEDGSIATPYMTVATDDNGNHFNYGYYESRIKFTNHNDYEEGTSVIPGTNILKPWGAFWLYPLENGSGLGTEIDIVENGTAGVVSGSIHEMENYKALTEEQASSWFKGENYDLVPNVYHRYGVYIEPNEVEGAATYTFYINGKQKAKVKSSHPLANQTIHLSMEIADTDYTDGLQGTNITELTNFEAESMIVDYVRVYEYNPHVGTTQN